MKTSTRKRHRMQWIALSVAALAVLVIATWLLRGQAAAPEDTALPQARFSLDYAVTIPQVGGGVLDVQMDMPLAALSEERLIYLARNGVATDLSACVDQNNNPIAYRDEGGLLAIGPIEDGVKSVRVSYAVRVGANSSNEYDSVTYTRGAMFDDLLVFCGEEVLMVPTVTPVSSDDPTGAVSVDRVSFRLLSDRYPQAVIPFATPQDASCSFSVDNPTWTCFNQLTKSAYCFGTFEKKPADSDEQTYFYLDAGLSDTVSQASFDLLFTLNDFYAGVFGSGLGAMPFVVLRNNDDDSFIYGGVGGQTAAVSIDCRMPEDCQTVSNTLYYAYFDSKVHAPNLRYRPNVWLYKGLCDYYVGASAEALPQSVREQFSIEPADSFPQKYLRYLYFSLKEPGFLVLQPKDEQQMYNAQWEYYINTKVPLILDAINYAVWKDSGESDALIHKLVSSGATEAELNTDELLTSLCGLQAEAIRKYFSGAAMIPNYRDITVYQTAAASQSVLDEINQAEEIVADLFYNQKLSYPYEPLFLLPEDEFLAVAARESTHYNTPEIQAVVSDYAPALHQLLMQYAYRVQLAGVKDITEPNIKGDIYETEARQKWQDFCRTFGAGA